MEEKEKRKIIYIGGNKPYEVLKPRKDREGYHEHGERKSLKGVSNLFLIHEFELIMEDWTANEIGRYIREQEEKRQKYSEKGLESKTI